MRRIVVGHIVERDGQKNRVSTLRKNTLTLTEKKLTKFVVGCHRQRKR